MTPPNDATSSSSTLPTLSTIRPEVRARIDSMVAVRRDLHRNPELGLRETRTSSVVQEFLRKAGIEFRFPLATTGVAGLVRAEKPSGRAILLRADMDGLPLQEENTVDYASQNTGVMHACGHDGHTSILLHTAELTQQRRATLGGDITFAFQPAEEGPGGALPMIQEGVMENPKIEAAFGLHLWNIFPVGKVGVQAGPAMAAADEFELVVEGKGGHGAHPDKTIDAVVVASHIVTAMQTLVSRNVDPFKTAVITVGTFRAGSNFNIIAERAFLTGTMRTFDPEVRAALIERLEVVVTRTAEAFGAKCKFVFTEVYPVTVNDPAMSEFVADVVAEVVGKENVLRGAMSMGAEDMSYFLEAVPGCFLFLGSNNPARGLDGQHHSPRFDFDEACLPIGTEIFLRLQERYFQRYSAAPTKSL